MTQSLQQQNTPSNLYPENEYISGWNDPEKVGFIKQESILEINRHYQSIQNEYKVKIFSGEIELRDEDGNRINPKNEEEYQSKYLTRYLCPEIHELNARYANTLAVSRVFRTLILDNVEQYPKEAEQMMIRFQHEFCIELFTNVYQLKDFQVGKNESFQTRLENMILEITGNEISLGDLSVSSDNSSENSTHAFEALEILEEVNAAFKSSLPSSKTYIDHIRKSASPLEFTCLMSSGMVFGVLISMAAIEFESFTSTVEEKAAAMNKRFSISVPGTEQKPNNGLIIGSLKSPIDGNTLITDDFVYVGKSLTRIFKKLLINSDNINALKLQLLNTVVLSASDERFFTPKYDEKRQKISWIFEGLELLPDYDIYVSMYLKRINNELIGEGFTTPIDINTFGFLTDEYINKVNVLLKQKDSKYRLEKLDLYASDEEKELDIIHIMYWLDMKYPFIDLTSLDEL